jgi:hypothetical protein
MQSTAGELSRATLGAARSLARTCLARRPSPEERQDEAPASFVRPLPRTEFAFTAGKDRHRREAMREDSEVTRGGGCMGRGEAAPDGVGAWRLGLGMAF